jgi:hypothetical protein
MPRVNTSSMPGARNGGSSSSRPTP